MGRFGQRRANHIGLPEKEMSENFIKRELYKIRQIPQTRSQNAPTRTGLYLKVMYFA